MKIECQNCGYEWNYKGNLDHATCPNCNRKTKAEKQESKNEKLKKFFKFLGKTSEHKKNR